MKKLSKIQLINLCLGLALAAVVILNICLLSTDIYHGTYTYKGENQYGQKEVSEFAFSENTYIWTGYHDDILVMSNGGYYKYFPELKTQNTTDSITGYEIARNVIMLEGFDDITIKRNSVFSFAAVGSDTKFICGEAVFLQVLYGILIIGFISALVVINKKYKKQQSKEKVSENTDTPSNPV